MKAITKTSFTTKAKWSDIFTEGITAILIILWIYVGITKLIDYRSFAFQMATSPVFKSIANLVTFGAPIFELIVALLLVVKNTRLFGLYLSFGLMFFFTGYVGYLMVYLPKLPCSCGGIISSLTWIQHLILNALLTLLTLSAIIIIKRKKRIN